MVMSMIICRHQLPLQRGSFANLSLVDSNNSIPAVEKVEMTFLSLVAPGMGNPCKKD